MLVEVPPNLNFWYSLAIISSLSWLLSSLAMDFIKKTTRPVSVFLISTLVLSWFTSNSVLSKFYFLLQRNPQADRFFRGHEGAGKTIRFVLLVFGNLGLYYFSEKSVACILTFLFLSIYCFCCLLCIQPYTDFGTLDFLLGATLNQTWCLLGLRSLSSCLVVVACGGIAGLRYYLQPLHTPGEGTSAEADQLESGQLLPPEEPPSLGAQLANEDTTQFGCILPLALSGSTNPLLDRWRLVTLVLNASRQFRYTLDLKKEEEKKRTIRKIRARAQGTRAAFLFQETGQKEKVSGTPGLATTSAGDYSINQEQLASITWDHDFSALVEFGGVRMFTGDNLQTARAIALECGIVGSDADATEPNLIEGKVFRALSELQRQEIADKIAVKVVRWGRSVYANIQKFIQFQLTVNVAALVINVVAVVSSGDVPLNAVQLLWVNLIMATLGALALATEPPTDELMHRPPIGRREPLITNIMWRNLLMQAFYQVTVLLILNFKGREILHLEHYDDNGATKVKNTLMFNAFVFCQIFNKFNARKPEEINIFKGVTKNYLFTGIVGLTILLQVIIVMFLGKFAGTVRLSWKLWLVSIAIGIVSWPLAIVGKLIPVPKTPLHEYFTRIWPGQRTLRGATNSRQEDGVERKRQ